MIYVIAQQSKSTCIYDNVMIYAIKQQSISTLVFVIVMIYIITQQSIWTLIYGEALVYGQHPCETLGHRHVWYLGILSWMLHVEFSKMGTDKSPDPEMV